MDNKTQYKSTHSKATFIQGGVDFDHFPAAALSPEQQCDQSDLQQQFNKFKDLLSKQSASVLNEYFMSNKDRTFEDIGDNRNLSRARIREILNKSLRAIRTNFLREGLTDHYAIENIESAKASALFGADKISLRDSAAELLTEQTANDNIDDDLISYLGETIENTQNEFIPYTDQKEQPFQSETLADQWANSQYIDDIESPSQPSDADLAHEKAVYRFVAKTQSQSTAQMFKKEFTLD